MNNLSANRINRLIMKEVTVVNDIMKQAEAAVREAGRLMLKGLPDAKGIVTKGFGNFVTRVDFQVQEYLLKKLEQILPGSNIIAEESGINQYSFEKPTWILDPVDGTANLMRGYNHSAISLGLFEKGKGVLGFVYDPFTGEMFTAKSGDGARLNGVPIHVSSCSRLEDCLVAFGTTPYDRSKAEVTFDTVQRIFMKCMDVRRSGSAALDLAYIACGRTDGFIEETLQPWDYAAGTIILEAAGGTVINWEGNPVRFSGPDSVLATNGFAQSALLEFVKR